MKRSIRERLESSYRYNDIRGVYGEDVDEEVAYRTARAMVIFLKCKEIFWGEI